MDVNKTEKKNMLNYFSVANKLYLEKMSKAEKQINEILVEIENINDTLNDIQQKIDENPETIDSLKKNDIPQKVQNISESIVSLYKDYPQNMGEDKEKHVTSLQDVETEPGEKRAKRYKENGKTKSYKKKFSWIGEFAFYVVIIAMVLGAFLLRSNSSGQPISFAGYSLFTVLTGSMESEIPKGSLVVTKNVGSKTLQIGDDITFMANKTTTITHRIIGIIENYQNTGERAFQTQGVMNEEPDKNLVPAVNVIGKVIWHSKVLGEIANFLEKNLIFLIFVVVVLIVFISAMKNIFKNDEPRQRGEQPTTSPKQEEKVHTRRIRRKREK